MTVLLCASTVNGQNVWVLGSRAGDPIFTIQKHTQYPVQDAAGRCPGAVREVSGRRPGGVREASDQAGDGTGQAGDGNWTVDLAPSPLFQTTKREPNSGGDLGEEND